MNYKTIISIFLTIGILGVSCQRSSDSLSESSGSSFQDKILARADSFELDTPYEPPPGDTLSLHASGFAKILCSAVFITGLDFEFAAENIGYFTAPYEIRPYLSDRKLDMENKAVHITLPNGTVRTAKYFGDQGCICLQEGKDELNFDPVDIQSSLPDPDSQTWPMGDDLSERDVPEGINLQLIQQAIDTAFSNPASLTAAYIVTYKNEIVGERYRDGLNMHTSLESWSMGIVRPVMEIYPYAWAFFVPFIIVTTFAVVNLLVGLIVNSMQVAHSEEEHAATDAYRDEVLDRLKGIEDRLSGQ